MTESPELSRVLVTGGSGFLGSHIVSQLLANPNTSVGIISRNPRAIFNNTRLSLHPADLSSETSVRAVFDTFQPQVVIHTASPPHTAPSAELKSANIAGTNNLLACGKTCSATHAFVYTSSDSAIQSSSASDGPLTEANAKLYDEQHYPSIYAMTKAVADAAVTAANCADLRTAVLRIPAVYGERDWNLLPQFVTGVRKNEHKMQVGANIKTFEFIYAGKAAEAHILAARALLTPQTAEGVAGEAFFISDGRPEPFFDFARRCYAAMGSPVEKGDITVIPMAAMQMMASAGEWAYSVFTLGMKTPKLRRHGIDHLDKNCYWSIEKAKKRLGYEPVVDQDAAIKRSMEWAVVNTP